MLILVTPMMFIGNENTLANFNFFKLNLLKYHKNTKCYPKQGMCLKGIQFILIKINK